MATVVPQFQKAHVDGENESDGSIQPSHKPADCLPFGLRNWKANSRWTKVARSLGKALQIWPWRLCCCRKPSAMECPRYMRFAVKLMTSLITRRCQPRNDAGSWRA